MRTAMILTCLAALAMTTGCVELDGQRISLRYNADKDELQLLLLYDGIHESGSDKHGTGAGQVAKAVEDGEFLILDWPMHFETKAIRKKADDKEAAPALRAQAREFADAVRTVPLGHYRDERGRIGVAQLVVISKASKLLRLFNDHLNAEIVAGKTGEWPRTAARMLAGAKKGEQWIRIDGHSIVATFPVHLREWTWRKREMFSETIERIAKHIPNEGREETDLLTILQMLSLTPITLSESPEGVTLRLGAKSAPSTFRFRLRESKKTGLDEVVMKHVPTNLDERIADALVSGKIGKDDVGLRALIEWGPPEDRARALMHRAERGKTKEARAAAAKLLAAFGDEWDRESGYPLTPEPWREGALNFDDWRKWYARMIR